MRENELEKVLIAAISENEAIGKDGEIPWHYSEDLKHFKKKTINHPVIMGSSTYRSLPEDFKPLPDRKNIVLTRSGIDVDESVDIANSLDEAWSIAEEHDEKAFIIGGATIYEQTLEDADKLVLTRIHEEYDGDTFFPDWDRENWKEVERDDQEELSFLEYERIT
jgi:dihydrofolate reductase